jgi:diguanylate cyclase (GGDEF)-like protein
MPSLSLMMADLNGLKNVNDQQGHLAGDQLIAGAGLVLRRSMRVTDLVFRFGGDEFLVLQPGADEAVAAATFRRVKVGCRRWAASHPGLPLSLALGWQIARTPQEADQALTLADAAMYRDKQREKARLARRT